MSIVWSKVCISAACNSTNLLTGGFCDDLIADVTMVDMIRRMFDEIIVTANAAGAGLDFDAQDKVDYCKHRFPKCKFSMLQV